MFNENEIDNNKEPQYVNDVIFKHIYNNITT